MEKMYPETTVGGLIFNRSGEIFLMKSDKWKGMYCIPGGHVESGESLKITQTFYGIFISYDRSVVEEYTFGENRLVTIGPIEAKRVSGWEDGAFVVETLDESKATLFETWRLQPQGVLVRDIRISRGEQDLLVQQQVFDRK